MFPFLAKWRLVHPLQAGIKACSSSVPAGSRFGGYSGSCCCSRWESACKSWKGPSVNMPFPLLLLMLELPGPWSRHRDQGCFSCCSLLSWMPSVEIPLLWLAWGAGPGLTATCSGWGATGACLHQALVGLLTQTGRWPGWVPLLCVGEGQYPIRVLLVFVGFLLTVELPKDLSPGSSFRLATGHFSLWGYSFHISPQLFST